MGKLSLLAELASVRIAKKALKYIFVRPFLRFNIYNRAQKYLGPDSSKFALAPRAIGIMTGKKRHLLPGYYKSISGERLIELDDGQSKKQNEKVIDGSSEIKVNKILTSGQTTDIAVKSPNQNTHRPLPTSTNLPLKELSSVWIADKVPSGRLDVEKLQELMLNRLADENYWNAETISKEYNIGIEYAESIINSIKQIRILIRPKLYHNLEYVARNNPLFQQTKHLIYHVDNRLRTEQDKQYDPTFEPSIPDKQIQDLIRPLKLGNKERKEEFPTVFQPLYKPQALEDTEAYQEFREDFEKYDREIGFEDEKTLPKLEDIKTPNKVSDVQPKKALPLNKNIIENKKSNLNSLPLNESKSNFHQKEDGS